MKHIIHIAMLDLKLMVRDRIYFFWTLAFPMVFILIFGNVMSGGGSDAKAGLTVLNRDTGKWGAYFVEQIKNPAILLTEVDKEPKKYNRMLIIPADFSSKIENREVQQLEFKTRDGANIDAAAQVEVKIVQAIAKMITQLILHDGKGAGASFFDRDNVFKNIVEVKSGFPEGTIDKVPSGFDHVIPGVIVQFILMMVLIYGGITVMMDRNRGVLTRMLYSSVTVSRLWGGKFFGRLLMGLIQAMVLIVIGKLFFNLNLGNTPLFLLIVLFMSICVASLSIFIGSVLSKEDIIVGVAVLLGNVFAALGGCWWPIEVVSPTFRTVGMVSPAYWAMDAFHKIIFFNKGFSDIFLNLVVFMGFTLVFTVLAIRFFKTAKS
ncbi:MAG: ABC transporter permease [bacterium]|nr:ABC transporter permease [bacterium]